MLSLSIRKAMMWLFAVPFVLSLQGCTDDEVLGTVAGIAIIGGAVAVGAAAANNHGDDHRGWHDHGGHWGRRAVMADDAVAGGDQSTDDLNSIAMMSAHYNIPMGAASQLKDVLNSSLNNRSVQPIYDMGLSASDLQAIGSYQMISDVGVNNVASKLQIPSENARSMVQQMIADAKTAKQQQQ